MLKNHYLCEPYIIYIIMKTIFYFVKQYMIFFKAKSLSTIASEFYRIFSEQMQIMFLGLETFSSMSSTMKNVAKPGKR